MPYASPAASPTAVINVVGTSSRPLPYNSTRVSRAGGHRRSQPLSSSFVDIKDSSSAFTPLPGLPRRTRSTGNPRRPRMFHIELGEDESSSGDNNNDEDINPSSSSMAAAAPPSAEVNGLGLNLNGTSLRVDVTNLPPSSGMEKPVDVDEPESVPFPCLSSPKDESSQASLTEATIESNFSSYRPPKSPIILKSNGQVLKPSLKSSFSSGNIPALGSPQGNSQRTFTRSAPTTPSLKAVHFADKDGVVIFQKSQRPTAVSLGSAAAEDTETETERDIESGLAYPFPVMAEPSGSGTSPQLVISSASSPIPSSPLSHILISDDMVRLECVNYDGSPAPALHGTVVVQNVSYAKSVCVRFTVDDWQTTSEVAALYLDAVSSGLTAHSRSKSMPHLGKEDAYSLTPKPKEWDRFEFTIRLGDVRNLESRKLYLVVRYGIAEWNGAEFWDNNFGKNYYIAFEQAQNVSSKPISPPAISERAKAMEAVRRTSSAPTLPPIKKTQSWPPIPLPRDPHPPTHLTHSRSQSNIYPSHHLRLSNYVPPKSSPSPPLKPVETDRGVAPISPPESPVVPLRMVQGHPASIVEDAAPSPLPTDLDHAFTTTRPSELALPIRERKLGIIHVVKTITPPESKEQSPDVANIPLPLSSSSSSSSSSDDDSGTDSELVPPASDSEPSSTAVLNQSVHGMVEDRRPSSGDFTPRPLPRTSPTPTPRSFSPSRSGAAMDRQSPFSLSNNAPPEFLQRFCFYGSSSGSVNASHAHPPPQMSPPIMVFGGEPMGGASIRRGMWDAPGFGDHVSMMRA